MALTPSAHATTFNVTTTADGNNGACTPALCTLRDAVNAANTSVVDPVDTVNVPDGRYVLTSPLGTNSPMDIRGGSTRGTVVDANGNSRVFTAQTNGVVRFFDLTITGGDAGPADGGGILNQASGGVTLTRVALVGNTSMFQGGGIASPLESMGPGAMVGAPITIVDSLVANNTVEGGVGNGQGGGIAAFGDITITNSTVARNSSSNPGANQGGGILSGKDITDLDPTPLTLVNATIAGNSIEGMGANAGGGIAGIGVPGPMAVLTELRATNSLIAANTVNGATQNCALTNVALTQNNLADDATCALSDAGSKQGVDARLGALVNNGGPTDTRALSPGSPAIDAGTNTGCPSADQRGTTRPQNVICDIGAYERVLRPDLEVSQTAPGRAKLGKRVTFTIVVANTGELPAQGVALTDRLPAPAVGATPADCAFPKGKKPKKKKGKKAKKAPRRNLSCSFGTLGAGAKRTIEIAVKPRKGKRLVNTAVATTTSTDQISTTNDRASATVALSKAKQRKKK